MGSENAAQGQPVHSGSSIVSYALIDSDGRSSPLDGASRTIGRAPGNQLVIDDESVARRHARLVRDPDGGWRISDLGSITGTFVNGRRVGSEGVLLADGDVIGLGHLVRLTVASMPETPAPARPRPPRTQRAGFRSIRLNLLGVLGAQAHPVRRLQAALASPLGATARSSLASVLAERGRALWIAGGVLGAVLVLLVVVIAAAWAGSGSGSEGAVASESLAPAQAAFAAGLTAAETDDLQRVSSEAIDAGAPRSAPEAPAVEANPPAAPTPACADDSIFYGDITVPDGETFYPGGPITKTWRLQNKGTCTWGPDYRFRFVSGNAMGAAITQTSPIVAPGSTGDVTVVMTAPRKTGDHVGTWQMVNAGGKSFGWTVAVKIHVAPPPTATPIPTPTKTPTPTKVPTPTKTPTPGPDVHLWADQQTIQAGAKTVLHVQVKDAAAAWLDGETVIGGQMDLEVAPCFPITYTLDVQMKNGTHGYSTLPIKVEGTCTVPPPDLVVDYVLLPAKPKAGKAGGIYYSVTNRGEGPAIGFDLMFGVGITATQTLTFERAISLGAGQQITATRRFAWGPRGVYSTTLFVSSPGATFAVGDNARRGQLVEVK